MIQMKRYILFLEVALFLVAISASGVYADENNWELKLIGAVDDTIMNETFSEMSAVESISVEWEDLPGNIYEGVPLWYIIADIDDCDDARNFNEEIADTGYNVIVVSDNGDTREFLSTDIKNNSDYILVNRKNGELIQVDESSECTPLILAGDGVTAGKGLLYNITEIKLTDNDWVLDLHGAVDDTIKSKDLSDAVSMHGLTWEDSMGNIYGGIPLWYLVASVDDEADTKGFSEVLADIGYTISVNSIDGKTLEISSDDVKSDNYIVANSVNGKPIKLEDCDYWPVALVGDGIADEGVFGGVTGIELTEVTIPYINIIKYAVDGETIIDEKQIDLYYMLDLMKQYGEPDGVSLMFQGPTLNPVERWNPDEDINTEMYEHTIKGTGIRDLCSSVGADAMVTEKITLISSDGDERTYSYVNIFDPEYEMGPAVLAWWYEDLGYYPKDIGFSLYFDADDGVFGNENMRNCLMPDYWTYHLEGPEMIEYPSAAGQHLENIEIIRIDTGTPVPTGI